MDFLINHKFRDIHKLIFMMKNIGDNYKIYGLIIVKIVKTFASVRLWIFK